MKPITTPPPERSLEQRRKALKEANRIRFYRAQMKRDLTAGLRHPADVLLEPAPELATMQVLDVLLSVPGVGRKKALDAMGRAGASASKSVGGLSPRQRRELVRLLNENRLHPLTLAARSVYPEAA